MSETELVRANLPNAVIPVFDNVVNQLDQLKKETQTQESEIKRLRQHIQLLQYRHFGKKSEQVKEQFSWSELLDSAVNADVAESSDTAATDEETIEVKGYSKAKGGRKGLSPLLPREEVVIDLPADEKRCKIHGIDLKQVGDERSETLDYVPASAKVIVTIRPKYICPCCAKELDKTEFHIAKKPKQLIERGIATPSLLTHIVMSKMIDSLPLYRQESIFERIGVELSRGTMAEWMIALGKALQPLINLLNEELVAGEYISCDETRLRVLTEQGKPVDNLHYLWVRYRPPTFGKPICVFDYANSRRAQVAKELLEEFTGYLQVDGYVGYAFTDKIVRIIRLACLAHIRRKFFEAAKVSGKKEQISNRVLAMIKKLYRFDKEARDETLNMTTDERTAYRRKLSDETLTELESYLIESQRKVPPKSATGKAISYAINQWALFKRVYDDIRLPLDNNGVENKIRPIALGRKNYLFCATDEGASAAANIYSIIATATANGKDVSQYLKLVIEKLPQAESLADLEALLPTT